MTHKIVCLFVFVIYSTYLSAQCINVNSSTPYIQNFESSNGGWTSGGTNSDWQWGTPTKQTITGAGGGSRCWIAGGLSTTIYEFDANSFIQSPCFNLSGLTLPYITFKVFWETEGRFDGANLQYSINGGTTWRVIGDANQPTDCLNQNWYNNPAVTFLPRGNPSPGWSGSVRNNVGGALCTTCQIGGGSGQWVTAKITLPASIYPDLQNATNVRFRFAFGAGTCCNGYDGFAIDDFSISQAPLFPAQPTVTATQPSCSTPTGSATITPVTGELYSFNGGTFGSVTTFSNLAPGTYNIVAQNAFGCNSQPRSITIIAPPGNPAAPTASTVQPTCTTPTGSFTISAISGATYSVNGGPYSATLTYSGFAPGSSHTVIARTSDGCTTNTATITFNAIPNAPAPPGANVTNPTCVVPTGTITINAVSGIEYNFNGGAFSSSPAPFSGLAPGSYTIIARNTAGCTAQQVFIIGQPPAAPPPPAVGSTVQPNCSSPTGSFTITPIAGATYSVNNSAYSSVTTYANLAPGTFTIRYRDASGCISQPLSVQIVAPPNAAEVPVAIVDQPTCLIATATIRIVAQTGYTYSLNNGPFIANLVFTGLRAGSINSIRGQNSDGCITPELQVVIGQQPTAPQQPDTTVIQPTCVIYTGTIILNAPNTTNPEYSYNGLVFQSSPRLENLAPGTYSVFVRDKNTGCISNARNVLIKALDCTNEIFIPNVFSPNGNSKNERFKVYGNRIVKIDMKIYNQWGQQVAVVTDRKIGWDGTHKGKPQPAGVYIYVLDAAMEDGSLIKRKGSITLIR